jgi:hypothetical protein
MRIQGNSCIFIKKIVNKEKVIHEQIEMLPEHMQICTWE